MHRAGSFFRFQTTNPLQFPEAYVFLHLLRVSFTVASAPGMYPESTLSGRCFLLEGGVCRAKED